MTTAPISYRDDGGVEIAALAWLRARCEFADRPADFLSRQLEGARWLVHAHDGDRLVGFARAISDGVTSAYVSSVMVDPDYRRRGIGRAMIERLMAGRDAIRFVLHARVDASAFYAALGFAPSHALMMRDRRPG